MKKVIGLLAVFAVVISLAGCQKTPDTPVVIGKNYEQMMKLALSGQQTDAPVAEQVKAPERYTLES